MKNQFFRPVIVRRVVNKMVLTAVITAAGFAAHAQASQVKQDIPATPTASVKYIGSQEEMVSVSVKYNNEAGHRFTVTVRDQEGFQLYQGSFTEKKFSKTF